MLSNSPSEHIVDIIIPVYRGHDETLACLLSVIASVKDNRTSANIIVINDDSPEAPLVDAIEQLAKEHPFILLHNSENMGFVATVNRGMQHSSNDVILLNSDTEVANDWIDRMSYHGRLPNVASVTPFSNNATICSYPNFCENNELPYGESVASLDKKFATHLEKQHVIIPTGVGFCFYIPRSALNKIGDFDAVAYGRGYGEENDFCQRAIDAGYRNLHALDVFVLHKGQVSFQNEGCALQKIAYETLTNRYPDYQKQIDTFISEDPAQLARFIIALDVIRVPLLFIFADTDNKLQKHINRYQKAKYPIIILSQKDDFINVQLTGNTMALHAKLTEASLALLFNQLKKLTYKNLFFDGQANSPLDKYISELCQSSPRKVILHIVNHADANALRYIQSVTDSITSDFRHFVLHCTSNQQVLHDKLNDNYEIFSLLDHEQWHINALLAYLSHFADEIGLHIHSLNNAALSIGNAFCEQSVFPVSVSLHDTAFSQTIIRKKSRFFKSKNQLTLDDTKRKNILKKAKCILANSSYSLDLVDYFIDKKDKNKYVLIPPAIEQPAKQLLEKTEILTNALKEKAKWQQKLPTVAIVGMLDNTKQSKAFNLINLLIKDKYQVIHIGTTTAEFGPLAKHRYIQHGTHQPYEVPELLKAYSANIAIFFSEMSDGFCYPVSDIYGTIPILVPNISGYPERIQNEHLGAIYRNNLSAKKLLKHLTDTLNEPMNINPQIADLKQMISKTNAAHHQSGTDVLAKDIVLPDELQHYIRKNLADELIHPALAKLSNENYMLQQEIQALEQALIEVKNQKAITTVLKTALYRYCSRFRYYIKRAIELGPIQTIQRIMSKFKK